MRPRTLPRGSGPLRRPVWKLAIFGLCCALPVAGAAQLWLDARVPWPLPAYAAVSLVAYVLVRLDKGRASNARRRIPERVLHLAELAGGWPGSMWAQQLARHKTRKAAYQVVFWLTVLVHQALWGAWLWHVHARSW